jgi:deoxycytidylate deaminase
MTSEPSTTRGKCSVHAEEILLKKDIFPKSTLYIVRLMLDATWGISRPCLWCTQLIHQSNIDKVVYSVEQGVAYSVKTRDLI